MTTKINADRPCWLLWLGQELEVAPHRSGRGGRQSFRLVRSYVWSYVDESAPERTRLDMTAGRVPGLLSIRIINDKKRPRH